MCCPKNIELGVETCSTAVVVTVKKANVIVALLSSRKGALSKMANNTSHKFVRTVTLSMTRSATQR